MGGVEAPWISADPGHSALFRSFRHCVLRLTENNSQPLMTKLQWLFAFLEHSQVRAGGEAVPPSCADTFYLRDLPATSWKLPLCRVSCSPGWHRFMARAPGPVQCPSRWAGASQSPSLAMLLYLALAIQSPHSSTAAFEHSCRQAPQELSRVQR